MGAQYSAAGASPDNLSEFLRQRQSVPYNKWTLEDREKYSLLMKQQRDAVMAADQAANKSRLAKEIATPPIQSGYEQVFNYDDGSKPFTPSYRNRTPFEVSRNPLDIFASGPDQQLGGVYVQDNVFEYMQTQAPSVFGNLTHFNASVDRGIESAHTHIGRSFGASNMQASYDYTPTNTISYQTHYPRNSYK